MRMNTHSRLEAGALRLEAHVGVMTVTYAEFEAKLRFDPGQRGFAKELPAGAVAAAAAKLMESSRVAVATGFFIPKAGAIETDGPPGTAFLARALEQLGKEVIVLCPDSGAEAMKVAKELLQTSFVLKPLQPGPVASNLLDELNSDVFVGLEYCGQGADGLCRNMRGIDVTAHVPILDGVLAAARERGIFTIAIGDGGNELGCGSIGARVAILPDGMSIASASDADTVICSGISNWGAYVLVAVLSVLSGEHLLPTADEEYTLLQALCDVGVVDGVTGLRQPTVDGVNFDLNRGFLRELHELTNRFIAEQKVAATRG